jgi:MFS transporter, DHA3 family, macrolide efflux protein
LTNSAIEHTLPLSDEMSPPTSLFYFPQKQQLNRSSTSMKAFYILSAVQVLSFIGSSMTAIAVGIWVFSQTGDTTPVLLTVFFGSIPQMLGGAFTGVLIDRWDKRHALILVDIGQAVGTVVLMFSLLSGGFELWHLYLISLWQGIFGMIQAPTMLAFITTLVPDHRREHANAIQQTTIRIAGMIAPAMTGALYGAIGVPGVVLIDFITFVGAVVVTSQLAAVQHEPQANHAPKPASIRLDMAEGIRFLLSQRGLLWLVVHGTLINFFLSSVLSLATPYILTITRSPDLLGLVLGVLNAGPIAGALIMAAWGGTRPRIHTIMPAIMVISLVVIAYGLAQTPVALIVSAFCILLPMPMVTSMISAIVQFKTPQQIQGRVFAVIFQLASLANPLALLLTGPFVDNLLEPATRTQFWQYVVPIVGSQPGAGMRLLTIISGGLMLIVTLLFYANPLIRRVEKSPEEIGLAA